MNPARHWARSTHRQGKPHWHAVRRATWRDDAWVGICRAATVVLLDAHAEAVEGAAPAPLCAGCRRLLDLAGTEGQ